MEIQIGVQLFAGLRRLVAAFITHRLVLLTGLTLEVGPWAAMAPAAVPSVTVLTAALLVAAVLSVAVLPAGVLVVRLLLSAAAGNE